MKICEKRIIVFIDLLGFSNYIRNNDGDKKVEKVILDLMNKMKSKVADLYKELKECEGREEFIVISDSIIISLPLYDNSSDSFLNLFQLIAEFQYLIMENNWLCRGGIAVGNVYHDKEIIFGKAYIEAVELEKKAIYPRIILSKEVIEIIKDSPWEMWTLQDKDGCIFIDYLQRLKVTVGGDGVLVKLKEKIVNTLNSETNNSIIEKYIWLMDYFNFSLKEPHGYDRDVSQNNSIDIMHRFSKL